jgi:hypothetical protein
VAPPSAPRNQAAESGLRRIDVELAATQPNLAALVDIVAWKAARPRLMSFVNSATGLHTRRRPTRLQTELERRPVPPLSPGAPRSPSRTAVGGPIYMAEIRRALFTLPFLSRGAAPELLGVVVVAWGWGSESRGSPLVKA